MYIAVQQSWRIELRKLKHFTPTVKLIYVYTSHVRIVGHFNSGDDLPGLQEGYMYGDQSLETQQAASVFSHLPFEQSTLQLFSSPTLYTNFVADMG